jgi:hypothetical protein
LKTATQILVGQEDLRATNGSQGLITEGERSDRTPPPEDGTTEVKDYPKPQLTFKGHRRDIVNIKTTSGVIGNKPQCSNKSQIGKKRAKTPQTNNKRHSNQNPTDNELRMQHIEFL